MLYFENGEAFWLVGTFMLTSRWKQECEAIRCFIGPIPQNTETIPLLQNGEPRAGDERISESGSASDII